jgi:hypothetical protein
VQKHHYQQEPQVQKVLRVALVALKVVLRVALVVAQCVPREQMECSCAHRGRF